MPVRPQACVAGICLAYSELHKPLLDMVHSNPEPVVTEITSAEGRIFRRVARMITRVVKNELMEIHAVLRLVDVQIKAELAELERIANVTYEGIYALARVIFLHRIHKVSPA